MLLQNLIIERLYLDTVESLGVCQRKCRPQASLTWQGLIELLFGMFDQALGRLYCPSSLGGTHWRRVVFGRCLERQELTKTARSLCISDRLEMLWRVGALPLRNRADKGTRNCVASIHPSVYCVTRGGGVVPRPRENCAASKNSLA